MKLEAYSLKNILFQGEAKAINCKTAVGEITVLDHHKPLVSILEPGVVRITSQSGEETFLNVKSGFLEVNSENKARLILEEAAS